MAARPSATGQSSGGASALFVAKKAVDSPPDYMWVTGREGAQGHLVGVDNKTGEWFEIPCNLGPRTRVPTSWQGSPAVYLPTELSMDKVSLYIRAPKIDDRLIKISNNLYTGPFNVLWCDVSRDNKLQRAGGMWPNTRHSVPYEQTAIGKIDWVEAELDKLFVYYATSEYSRKEEKDPSFIPFYIPADNYRTFWGYKPIISVELDAKDRIRGSKGAANGLRTEEERRAARRQFRSHIFANSEAWKRLTRGVGMLNSAFSHTIL